jgi:hypothetical protein
MALRNVTGRQFLSLSLYRIFHNLPSVFAFAASFITEGNIWYHASFSLNSAVKTGFLALSS